jgi:hypothetical protein
MKRLLPISVVAGALSALAFAVPAGATNAGVCQINGTADTNPDVQLVSGAGSYTFSSGDPTGGLHLLCAGADTNNVAAGPGVGNVETDSTGTYSNVVCGTGFAGSTANGPARVVSATGNTALADSLVAAIPGSNYTITFAGGQGALLFGAGSSITGGGAVSITAQGDSDHLAGGCTSHFTVTGALVGTF